MSAGKEKSLLFTPLNLRGVTLKNRIVVSPMCQYSCEGGYPNDYHFVHYGSFATGGAGVVFVEASGVEARGRISPACPGIWKDEQIESFKRIARFIKSQGSLPGLQLAHAGRKASTVPPFVGRDSIADDQEGGWPTIGPSAIPFSASVSKVPKEATIEDIEEIKAAWVAAALRGIKAGFEIFELHFAHGYLVSSFLSPISNQRHDKYGGSLENRMRFGLEIFEDVRNAVPDNIPIGVRISVSDYVEGGWDVQQSIEFAKELQKLGVDFLDCSSGGMDGNVEYSGLNASAKQREAASYIQKEIALATCAVSKIVNPYQAERILRNNEATLIFIGRAFLNNPHWPFEAADALDAKSFEYIVQYDYCIGWKAMAKWRTTILKEYYPEL